MRFKLQTLISLLLAALFAFSGPAGALAGTDAATCPMGCDPASGTPACGKAVTVSTGTGLSGSDQYTCPEHGTYDVTKCQKTLCSEKAGVITVPSTCTTSGSISYVCPVHGRYTVSTTAAQHTYRWLPDGRTEPTCEEGGSAVKKCQVCGDRVTVDLEPLGHETQAVPAVPATCTKTGVKAHWRCTREGCGKLFLDSAGKNPATAADLAVPKAAHTLTEHAGTDATCTAAGTKKHFHCSVCGSDFADAGGGEPLSATVVPALGHDLTEVAAREPEGDTPGTVACWRCARCGKLFLDPEGGHPLDPEDAAVPPGSMIGSGDCAKDGCSEAAQTITRPPTCTEDGEIEYVCPVHGRYTEKILPAGHDLWQVAAQSAQVGRPGTKEHWQCRRCGTLFYDRDGKEPADAQGLTIPALDPVPVISADTGALRLEGGTIALTVSLADLTPGRSYTVAASLTDADTGSPLGGSGTEASSRFTAEGEDTERMLTFAAPVSSLRGRDLSAKIRVLDGDGGELARADLSGAALHIPDPAVSVKDASVRAEDERAVLTAELSYADLDPGEEYTARIALTDSETGEPLRGVDGRQAESDARLIPAETDGTVQLELPVDLEEHGGREAALSAEIRRDGETVARSDEEASQTVRIPAGPERTIRVTHLTAQVPDFGEGDATLSAELSYAGLTPGSECRARAWLVDVNTGEAILQGSERITLEKTFTPAEPSGTVAFTFSVSPEVLAGKDVSCMGEVVRASDGRTLAETGEPGSGTPSVAVQAPVKPAAFIEEISADGPEGVEITVSAAVRYEGLTAGTEYEAAGWLVDAETGEGITTGGGKIQARQVFTPDAPEGTVTLTFRAPASVLQGRKISAAAEVRRTEDGRKVAETGGSGDGSPAVLIPSPAEAPTLHTESLEAEAEDGEVTLQADLAYTGLTPGSECTARGKLVDAETGEEITADGAPITASETFCPDAVDGTVTLIFRVQAAAIAGREITVQAEILAEDGSIIAATDPDEPEAAFSRIPTGWLPVLALEKLDAQESGDGSVVTVSAALRFSGLTPAREYVAAGKLVDAETGEPVSGAEAELRFTPQDLDGSVELIFPDLPREALAGRTLAVQGEIRRADSGRLVAQTGEPDAESPALKVSPLPDPEDPEGAWVRTECLSYEDDVLTVTASYGGVTPGRRYVLTAQVMDADTGEPVASDGRELGTRLTFVPEETEGTLTLEIQAPPEALAGRHIFVHLTLLDVDGNVVAAGTDGSGDSDLTLRFPAPASPSPSPVPSPSASADPTDSPEPSGSPEPPASSSPTVSPDESPSPSPSPSAEETPDGTPQPSGSPSGSAEPAGSPSGTVIPEPDKGPSASPSASAGLSPGTGDDMNLWVPAAALAAGILIILVIFVRSRRRRAAR